MTNEKKEHKQQISKEISLDDLLINIQKSVSRVSNRSSKVPINQARSLIYGDVDFSIEVQVEGEGDKIILKKEGGVKLSMSGRINADIRDDAIDE